MPLPCRCSVLAFLDCFLVPWVDPRPPSAPALALGSTRWRWERHARVSGGSMGLQFRMMMNQKRGSARGEGCLGDGPGHSHSKRAPRARSQRHTAYWAAARRRRFEVAAGASWGSRTGTTAATAGVTGEREHGQSRLTAPLHNMARRPFAGWAATRSSLNACTTGGRPPLASGRPGGGRRGVCRRGVGGRRHQRRGRRFQASHQRRGRHRKGLCDGPSDQDESKTGECAGGRIVWTAGLGQRKSPAVLQIINCAPAGLE